MYFQDGFNAARSQNPFSFTFSRTQTPPRFKVLPWTQHVLQTEKANDNCKIWRFFLKMTRVISSINSGNYKKAIRSLIPMKSINTVSLRHYQNTSLFVWAAWSAWSALHSNIAPTNGSSFIFWLTANVVSVQEISFQNLYFLKIPFNATRDTETEHFTFKVAKKQK